MCINEESCKRNLIPTNNYCERFGRIFICENMTIKEYMDNIRNAAGIKLVESDGLYSG